MEYLQECRSHNWHEKTLVKKHEKLLLHHRMGDLNNGVTEFQRIHEMGQVWYVVHIIRRQSMPIVGLDVQFTWEDGVKSTETRRQYLEI